MVDRKRRRDEMGFSFKEEMFSRFEMMMEISSLKVQPRQQNRRTFLFNYEKS